MKKMIIILLLLLALGNLQHGKVIGTLPVDYLKLPILRMDDRQIYVVDKMGKRGYIFDKKTLKKVAEFGKPGQGPGEYTGVNSFAIDDRYIYVSANYKLCVFTKKGKLIKEIKERAFITDLLPIGNNFVGQRNLPTGRDSDDVTIQFSLYDSNMQKKKDFFRTTVHAYVHFRKGKKITHLFNHCFDAAVYDDLIIIGTTEKDFYFIVFNKDGEMLYEIKKDVEKRKISSEKKRELIDKMRRNIGERQWKAASAAYELEIPDFVPAYQSFFVDDGKIYVICYPSRRGHEIVIMDIKGNLISAKKYLTDYYGFHISANLDYLENGKLYKIIQTTSGDNELHEYEVLNLK